jgi:hypothetical protein
MLKDEIEKKNQFKKKKLESIELTYQTHDSNHGFGITSLKLN